MHPNTAEPQVINFLPLDMIQPDPNQPRKVFDKDALKRLSDDIKKRGVLQPITVRIADDNQMMIVMGERRYRACKMAKLETIPTIAYEAEDNAVDRLFDQVSENLSRENLNPMEMARFFNSLNVDHGIKISDMTKVIAQHGFKQFERSYISNMRRLIDLPEWAQQKINDGELTAAHGKHILKAKDDEKVLAEVKQAIEEWDDDREGSFTVKRTDELIDSVFSTNHIDLNKTWGENALQFNNATCEDCKTKKTISGNTYCLNKTCFDEKQQKAIAKKQKATNKNATSPANNSEADAEKNERQNNLKACRVERTQEHLDEWLRQQLTNHLDKDKASRYAVVLWMACGAPNDYGRGNYLSAANIELELEQKFISEGINLTLKSILDHTDLELLTVTEGVHYMDRKNLRKLAHHCDIKLQGNYTVDEAYLSIKSKTELATSTPEKVQDRWDDWTKTCKRPTQEIIDGILQHVELYGVPTDLEAMYTETA